ncbi:hypothetical protein [Bacillus methanolicus]|nr:hypothetical protein [Bacillus methanolicus]EIJ80913.1 hypothetical protein MGA3_11480 [Bacillus methanolicus MGA3]
MDFVRNATNKSFFWSAHFGLIELDDEGFILIDKERLKNEIF